MKTLHISFLLSVITIFVSCKKTIDFDSDHSHSKFVVNSVLESGTSPTVFITKSKRIAAVRNNNFETIKNAEIFLYENKVKVGKFNYIHSANSKNNQERGSKYILNEFKVKENATYSVSINDPKMGDVSAETKTPVKVEVSNIVIKLESVTQNGQKKRLAIAEITFKSPIETSFFRIECTDIYWGRPKYTEELQNGEMVKKLTDIINVYHQKPTPIGSDYQIDPLIKTQQKESFSELKNHFYIFNNDLIKNKSYTLRFVVEQFSSFKELEDSLSEGGFFQAKIELKHLHKDLYLYYKSIATFYDNNEDYFNEPVIIYSNIKNGVGIFTSETPSIATGTYGVYPMAGKTYEFPQKE